MAEVLFYHLTESTLEDALPGLLEKSVAARLAGGRADRHAKSGATRSTRICGPSATIPSWRTGPTASRMRRDQPVLLTTGAGQRQRRRDPLHRRRRRAAADVDGYERAVFMFDGHDAGAGRSGAGTVEGA